MEEPGRCAVPTGRSSSGLLAIESMARPADQASAGIFDLLRGRVRKAGPPTPKALTDADLVDRRLPPVARSKRRFEGSERWVAFCVRRGDGRVSPIEQHGEAKPMRGGNGLCTANVSENSIGAAVVGQGTRCAGLDNTSVRHRQLDPNCDSKKLSDVSASTSTPIPRAVPGKSRQREAVSRRSRHRVGHADLDHRGDRGRAGKQFEMVPAGNRLAGLHGLSYGDRFNMTYLWDANRLLGLDPFDWLILLAGGTLSGALVLLM
jgi:hypothetical protein